MTTQESSQGNGASPEDEGMVVFWHLRTPDAAAARAFYGKLFGWDFKEINAITFAVLNRGQMIGCLIGDQEHSGGPGSVLYIQVADLPGKLRQARELGAAVVAGPEIISGTKAVVDLSDPSGTVIGLWTDRWRGE